MRGWKPWRKGVVFVGGTVQRLCSRERQQGFLRLTITDGGDGNRVLGLQHVARSSLVTGAQYLQQRGGEGQSTVPLEPNTVELAPGKGQSEDGRLSVPRFQLGMV